MSAEKNLFPYELAVVAIFKDEAPYLNEWLDYHLLAGVDHFYLYNNDSTDNFEEVLSPYVAANLVTLINFPGKTMQMPAYLDALNRFRFFCRYMAFIDLDEFIFPKTNQSIAEVVDEILFDEASSLAIGWRTFGSNGQKTADYSRGVLERFTRRAPDKWQNIVQREEDFLRVGNMYVKLVTNPRRVKLFLGPHVASHFGTNHSVNEHGEKIDTYANESMSADKIIINHYYLKSLEEFTRKSNRGSACLSSNDNKMLLFDASDRNEIFDDGILKYRAARAENFYLESEEQRRRRAEKILIETLMQRTPFDAPPEFFVGKLETFLTCRALAEKFGTKIGTRSAEEFALVWINQCFVQNNRFSYAELQLFMGVLPEILSRPFPLCKKLNQIAREKIFPVIYADLKASAEWSGFYDYDYVYRLLNAMK